MKSNVIPFPAPSALEADEPVIRRDTVASLLTAGRTPRHGDFVFSVRYRDDEGDLIVSGPGTGFIESGTVEPAGDAIRINWPKGPSIVARGDAILAWYPAP